MKRHLVAILAIVFSGLPLMAVAHAESAAGYKAYVTEGKFEDVMFELTNAIVDRGLLIDYTGHLQNMLDRTSEAVGSATTDGSKSPYLEAKYLQFCSAKLSFEAVSADPFNIAICPYVVFIFELKSEPGKIHVGYRRPIAGSSPETSQALGKVEALLNEIAQAAVE